jgi:formylglycine-generating enzyme required for sulfatase activity
VKLKFVTPGVLFLTLAVQAAAQRDLHFQQFRSLPSEDKRWALLIGVDRYEDRQLGGLDGASNDARSLAKLLVERSGFRQDHIVVLASGEAETRRPTRSEILFRLGNILQQVPPDGLLLLSFSGHGMERGGRAFLLPADARLSDAPEILQQVSLDVEVLRQIIARRGIQQVLVLLDACRNDPGGRADSVNPLSESFVKGFDFDIRNREVQAFATLYSTAVGDRAWENKEVKLGYFTWAISEALNGRAANERGEVTLGALVRYVQESVPMRVALDLGAGKRQRPFARIEGYRAEELVLGVVPQPPKPVSSAPAPAPAPVATIVSDDEAVYWKQCEQRGEQFCQIYLQRFPSGRFVPLAKALLNRTAQPEIRPAAVQTEPPARQQPAAAPPAPKPEPESTTRTEKPAVPSTGAEPPKTVPEQTTTVATLNRPPDSPLRRETPSAPSLRQTGEKQRNPRDKLTYVWIPPGRFFMGCAGEDCASFEQPRRMVQITKGFWIGQTEVTAEAYKRYRQEINAPPLPDRDQRGVLFNEAGDLKMPAVAATWDDARKFCEWAGMRLPTEAEWEYAATAGAPPGRPFLDEVAWYADNSGQMRIDSKTLWKGVSKPEDFYRQVAGNRNGPKAVALQSANAWSLYDMLGNASEWVADWFAQDAYRSTQAIDPSGPQQGQHRVVRGGSWLEPVIFVNYTKRSSAGPEVRNSWIGFRCVGDSLK